MAVFIYQPEITRCLNKDMRSLILLFAVFALTACEQKSPDDTSGLPQASQMEVRGQVRAPYQAVEFCNNHPDDFEEKCP